MWWVVRYGFEDVLVDFIFVIFVLVVEVFGLFVCYVVLGLE